MQIFILDENISKNVKFYTDKHVVKILTEICQILSTVHHLRKDYILPNFIYKKTHENHPCVLWTKKSKHNYNYVCHLGLALYNEYQYRYNKPEKFKRALKILFWCVNHSISVKDIFLTSFAQAMPDKYKSDNTVESYRQYYINEKSHLFKWTKRNKPYWV